LILYRWRPGGYERIAADEQGRVWLEPVGLWLGLSRDPQDGFVRLACFDRETGQEVGDYAAIRQELKASQALRADAERRAQEEGRARADAERRAQEEGRARADAERARADAERRAQADATALAEALARIRELEARTDRAGRVGP
jgi:hypothetical protein